MNSAFKIDHYMPCDRDAPQVTLLSMATDRNNEIENKHCL